MQDQDKHRLLPPKPKARPRKVSLWRYFRLFRQDILSAQPAHLYAAWMAEFRTFFFRSYLCNDPELVDLILKSPARDFPKSERIRVGLKPLLGNAVFNTNGEKWEAQRRIIDPAFEGGRLRDIMPAIENAGHLSIARLGGDSGQIIDIEAETSHLAMDVIFRTLFSVPVEDRVATQIFAAFQDHQKTQPVANIAALLPRLKWWPKHRSKQVRQTADTIRALIRDMTNARAQAIEEGTAPDDLATKIMTTPDPKTGMVFDTDEMVDQVAIFLLAGHETSAAALGWALYLLALFPDWQDRLVAEANGLPDGAMTLGDMAKLPLCRSVFRETLRLYPPVPMMVREASGPLDLRGRAVKKGAQLVISPWHLHRHERLWERPDEFDPDRFETKNGQECLRRAYIPFSAGPRVCPGAGFAMVEGPMLLAMLVRAFRFETVENQPPVPVAHLTVRSKDGIFLKVSSR